MQLEQLRALVSIMDEGTFEAAADALGVTPSAVSQRIKALESGMGQVLVRRTVPCTPTEAGSVLLRMARQVQVLESETRSALGADTTSRAVTPVVVNADSLATWFVPVLHEAAGWEDSTLDLRVEDQDHSSSLLRRGDVVGAVTTEGKALSGCRVEPLGRMRYLPMATPELRRRFTAGRGVDWERMPVVEFNAKDDLQRRFLQARGVDRPPPASTIPSPEAFLTAVKAGLGWAMLPELQLDGEIAAGSLVLLERRAHHDVTLHWQSWTLQSPRLTRITESVRRAAHRQLRPAGREH